MRGKITHVVLIATFVALVSISAAWAKQESCRIEGHVKDRGGQAVEGATVIVEPQGHVVSTDARGRFVVDARPGTVRLRADADTRGNVLSGPYRLEAGGKVQADLILEPILRESVVVTGTRTPRKLVDTPVRVEVIENEAIQAAVARTLADAVELAPGVRVEQNCQNCNFSQVRLLGLEGGYSQILLDGQPVMSPLAAVYGIEHIPAEFIESLEVVKGGGSALYGSGSVAGVVNVVPKDPSRRGGKIQYRQGWIDGEPANSVTGGYEWVGDNKRTGFNVFGQRDELSAIDTSGDDYTEVGERQLEALGARFVHRSRGGKSRLTLDASYTAEDRRGGNRLDRPVQEADIAEAVWSRRRNVQVGWDFRRGNAFDGRLTVARAETDRDTYYGAGRDPNAFGATENPLTVGDLQLNYRSRDHVLTWGAQFSRDELKDSQPRYDRFFDETYENLGAFVQSAWKLNSRIELVTGVRADDFSEIDGTIVSPRVAVSYAPMADWKVRASLASGFRGPQIFDEDLHITQVGGEGALIRNDETLSEESSLSAMLGVEWLPVWKGGQARFEANIFHTDLDDAFLIEETDDPGTPGILEFTRINSGGAAVYGLEVGGSLALGSRLTFDGGVTFQRARLDDPDPDFGSRNIARTPEFYGNAALIYKTSRAVDLRFAIRHTGTMEVPHYAGFIPEDRLDESPSFTTFDVGATWMIPLGRPGQQISLTGGVRNLTNEFQEDLDQGPNRDAGYVYGPRFPREFYVGVGYDF